MSESGKSKLGFSIRELLLVITLVAVGLAWWLTPSDSKSAFDIEGPLEVRYDYQRNPKSRSGGKLDDVLGINFVEGGVVIHRVDDTGLFLPADKIIDFRWLPSPDRISGPSPSNSPH